MSILKVNESNLAKVLLPGAKTYLESKIREQVKVMAEDIIEQAALDLVDKLKAVIEVSERNYIDGNVYVTLIINDKQTTSP